MTRAMGVRASLASIWLHRSLLYQLWERDFSARYRNGVLGVAWALLNPLLMLSLYSFVFVFVFRIRWGSGPDVKGNFVILLFTGLIVHGFFAEFVNRAPYLVSTNASYVKRVVFPLELLPLVPLLGALVNFAVGVVLTLVLLFALSGSIPATVYLLPIIFLPYVIMVVGLAYFLSATAVFMRDLTHLVGIVSTVAMFASPVLFPIESVPAGFRGLLYLNPLTLIVEQLREVAILGVTPDWRLTGVYSLIAIAVLCLGIAWFQALRKGFADVL